MPFHLFGLMSLAAFALSACTMGRAEATPTMSVELVSTQAVSTYQAQETAAATLIPPTATASQIPTPSQTPLAIASALPGAGTSSAGAAQLCDNAVYVKDITVPDGTAMTPGQSFTKTWEIANQGTCAWNTGYKLKFITGDAMGGSAVQVPNNVPSGQVLDISVDLKAPTQDGSYTGTWQMQNAQGITFGNVITVVIKVGSGSSTQAPSGATATATP